MINRQSAARSTSIKYKATQTYLSVTYQHNRLHLIGKRPQQRSQGPQQLQSTPSLVYFSKGISRRKNHITMRCRDECMPLTGFSTHWFLPWILSTYYDLRVAQLNNRRSDYFSLVSCVENVFPVFWYTLLPCHKICHRQKACCLY